MPEKELDNNPEDAPDTGQVESGIATQEAKDVQNTLTKEQVNALLEGTPFKDVSSLIKGYKEIQSKATKDSQRLREIERTQQEQAQRQTQAEELTQKVKSAEERKSYIEAVKKGPEGLFEWLQNHDRKILDEFQQKIQPLYTHSQVLDSRLRYGEELSKNEDEIVATIKEFGLGGTKDPVGAAIRILRGDKYGTSEAEARKQIARELEIEKQRKKSAMPPESGAMPGEKDTMKEEIDGIFSAGKKKLPWN